MVLPEITYKLPRTGKENPLDINSDLKYFIDAGGFTYLSASLEPFKEPYENKEINELIPMGYKAITVNERLDIIRKANLIRQFEEEIEENLSKYFKRIEKRYCILSNTPTFIEKYNTYINKLTKNDKWGYYDLTWESRQEAREFCMQSYKVKPCLDVLIVCRIISHTDWH